MPHLHHLSMDPTTVESVLELIDPRQDKMVLNVGGIRHETLVATLSSKPGTRLGELALHHRQERADEYFFDKNPEVFNAVIDYYRSGWFDAGLIIDYCSALSYGFKSYRVEKRLVAK